MINAMIAATIVQRVGTRMQDCRNFAKSCACNTSFQKSYRAGPVENGSLSTMLGGCRLHDWVMPHHHSIRQSGAFTKQYAFSGTGWK
jgi:hypothetical protein